MKKSFKVLSKILVLVMSMSLLAACGKEEKAEYTITLMNGETVLGSVKATEGETLDASSYSDFENQTDYSFNGWFATPSFMEQSAYDLSTVTFTEDITLYGNFISTAFVEDTHTYYIVGDSTNGGILKGSQWAGDLSDEDKATYQLVRTQDDKNEFAVTIDLYAGDMFQVISDWQWDGQHGYGYVKDTDASIVESAGGLSDSNLKANISIIQDGNYTVTLSTDMENSDRDAIVVVRNSDPIVALDGAQVAEEPGSLTGENVNIRVKGSWVSDWSDIKNLENVAGTSDWTITMDLEADTELCFAGYDGDTDTGMIMKEANVTDEASLALLSLNGNNIKVTETGSYTFTVSADDLSVIISKN